MASTWAGQWRPATASGRLGLLRGPGEAVDGLNAGRAFPVIFIGTFTESPDSEIMLRARHLLLLALAPVIPASGAVQCVAQEGRIAFQRTVKYDFEVPAGWGNFAAELPTGDLTQFVLFFNPSESLMMPVPEPESETTGSDRRAARIAERLRSSSASRSDQEQFLESYANLEAGAVAETREFMGRTFLISGERPAYAWKLSGEQRQFLGYTVQKATAVRDSSNIEAWFTPEIPVAAGPGPYGGLPGMILVVSVDEGHTLYAATDVVLGGLGEEGIIRPPQEGDEVSRDEYERIVAEKLDEVRTLRGSGRRRPPF